MLRIRNIAMTRPLIGQSGKGAAPAARTGSLQAGLGD
jgi:hypothetical protein